ncbi:hypothetical protein [Eubacterium sp. 1001713B170207_170306_E7]|nr:hypothetical protein [Eubacterium sp. 1001713B170207_170306_E7]
MKQTEMEQLMELVKTRVWGQFLESEEQIEAMQAYFILMLLEG